MKTKENKTSSPSGRHWGHYKALLEMPNDKMLKIIYDIMSLAMSQQIVLQRYEKVAITQLEKDVGRPRIHRLRPICIVEAELNGIAKQHWARDLMHYVEKKKTLTNDQYGGRRGRQAQSAVINKLLYYNIQHQLAEEAIFIDKDARSCFDRLIPQLISLENEKLGSPPEAGIYMIKALDAQRLYFRTGYGLTQDQIKKSKNTPKYGAGQGIGWSGQSCMATLNTVSKAMEMQCKGMIFTNPDGTIEIKTFGDYFVDDAGLGTNERGKSKKKTILEQAKWNNQKHSLYLHTSGGKNAIEKCLWYYVTFKFKNGRAEMMSNIEIEGIINTRNGHDSIPQIVPRFEVTAEHKTLGCYVSPTMNQTKQKKELIKKCEAWVQRVAASFLRGHEKLLAYDSVLLRQLEYRLAASCLTKKDCDEIMKTYIPVLCHGYHIHRNFNRELVCASEKYGGLNVLHLYDVMGTIKTKFLIKHLRLNDKTGKLLRISMEYTQLEIGIDQPFYTLDFHQWKTLITPTWVTHLWEYWTEADVKPDLTHMCTFETGIKNDKHIMDLFSNAIKNKKILHKLNSCRLLLRLITIADIMAIDGKSTLKHIGDGKNFRGSKMNWPKKEVPEEWWKIWRVYFDTFLVPYAESHKLGKSKYASHQLHTWKMYEKGKYISNGKVFFRRQRSIRESKIVRYNRSEDRIQLLLRGGKIVDVIQNGEIMLILNPSVARLPLIDKQSQKNIQLVPVQATQKVGILNSKCKAILNKHKYTTVKKMEKLQKLFIKGKLAAASDGSAHVGKKASFAFCLAKKIFGPLSEGNNEHNRRFGIETRCCGIVLHQLSHNHSLYNIFCTKIIRYVKYFFC